MILLLASLLFQITYFELQSQQATIWTTALSSYSFTGGPTQKEATKSQQRMKQYERNWNLI